MRGLLPGLLVAIAAVAFVGCGRDPAPSSPPIPTSRPAPPEARPWPGMIWTAARFEPAEDALARRFVSVAANGSIVVAVGYDDQGVVRNGRVMSAGETLDFSGAANPGVMAGIELVDVTDGPRGFVAIGTAAGEPSLGIPSRVAILTSTDGQIWQRVPDDAMFADAEAVAIARGPRGLLAIGASEHGLDGPVWRSVDGVLWARLSTTDLGLPGMTLASLDGSPSRWLATGGRSPAVITDSVDGLNWHATTLPPTGRADVKAPVVGRAVAGRWGWLAMGIEPDDCGFLIWEGDCVALPAAWWSDGFGDWGALANDSVPAAQAAARIVAAGDHGFVAVSGSGAWSSVDGLAWLPLASPDQPAVAVADVVVIGDRIVAVGESFSDSGGSSDGWIVVGNECCN